MKVELVLATRIAQPFNPIDMGLRIALGSDKIHSELIFNTGESFSSRGRVKNIYIPSKRRRRDKKGVQFAKVDYSKGKWIFNSFYVSLLEERIIFHRCENLIGRKYDSLGAIFGCGLGLPIDRSNSYWCSEVIACVLQEVLKIENDNLKPDELYQAIITYIINCT